MLDGRPANFTRSDMFRRNTIAKLLEDWELVKLVNPKRIENKTISLRQIKVLPYSEKKNYLLVSKYQIGSKHPLNNKS
jgi:hypothetical protein